MGRAPPARGQDRTFRPALGVIALHPVARARHPQRSHSCCLIEWITALDGRKGTAERINQLIVAITWYDNARKRGTDLPAHYRSHHRKALGGLPDILIVQNQDRNSTRLNSSPQCASRIPSSARKKQKQK